MAQETAHYRDEVEQVQRRFAEWRSTHAARALDVDKPSLRKWAERLQPQRRPTARRSPSKRRVNALPAFVELLASNSGTATSCLVEVESPRGAKLRLELKAIATSQLAELIRAFATT